MTVALLEHGTRSCYTTHRCRCDECREANRLYYHHRKRWAGEFPIEPSPWVSARDAVRHVEGLRAAGMGERRIAAAAGVTRGTIRSLRGARWGRVSTTLRLRVHTAEAILAVELEVLDGTAVSADEAVAIIAELVARGWTRGAIARRVVSPTAVALQIPRRPGSGVRAGHLRALRTLLAEPVPPRQGRSGRPYAPATGYVWQTIAPSTVGVPGGTRVPRSFKSSRPPLQSRRRMVCRVCGGPLGDHRIGVCMLAERRAML